MVWKWLGVETDMERTERADEVLQAALRTGHRHTKVPHNPNWRGPSIYNGRTVWSRKDGEVFEKRVTDYGANLLGGTARLR